jgi:hypothetical protein
LTLGHPQGGTLVLDGNKEELGLVDSSLIGMSGGSCTMRDGAELRDNWKNGSGGAVFATVSTGSAVFTMSGGIISGNTASTSAGYSKVFGGGVAVNAAGDTSSVAFIMSGGTISGNTLSASETAEYSNFFGGGVAVSASNESRCEFTMSGGTISGNIVSTSAGYSESLGGGVAVFGNTAVNSNWGKFTMSGGTISGNKAVSTANSTNSASGGGGVYVGYNVFEFTMTGGTISGNTASSSNGSSNGGGVYLLPQQDPDNFENSTCTIKGGAISGNKAVSTADSADSFGGGVSVSGGPSSVSVTMEGGTIGGNSAVDSGGGVYVYRATFKKEQGAVVYGSDGIENRNTASTGSAVEVYKWDTTLVKIKTQDTTAWADEELSAVFNGTDYTFEGDWDE